ncbi:MAG: tRNA preQ1(34) S-adenosylmethionine ribosyltransferase-isomerase QueA [Pseudomonadota bacterium]
MKVAQFDFDLPPECIAHTPANPRDAARLLHVSDGLHDRIVRDLPQLVNPGDVLVVNNSRVIPARLFTTIGEKTVEVLLHQPIAASTEWLAFARPARKLKEGMELTFAPGFTATVSGRTQDGQVRLHFPYDSAVLFEKLRAHGHMPLPPYITRADGVADQQDYQTIYAAQDGSVAAPTAGLHFTPQLMAALTARGVHIAEVTLHVGAGTFQPVKVEDTDEHVMHREPIEIDSAACATINAARAAGGKVVAVGTTSLRILESVAAEDGTLAPFTGETGIFITPGYRFKLVDRLLTNFHLPKSTLFMLVSAFAGLDTMQAAYQHAIASDYRFYSYGDTSLLERAA